MALGGPAIVSSCMHLSAWFPTRKGEVVALLNIMLDVGPLIFASFEAVHRTLQLSHEVLLEGFAGVGAIALATSPLLWPSLKYSPRNRSSSPQNRPARVPSSALSHSLSPPSLLMLFLSLPSRLELQLMPVCGQACTWQCAPQVDKCEMFGRNVWGLVVLLEHQLFRRIVVAASFISKLDAEKGDGSGDVAEARRLAEHERQKIVEGNEVKGLQSNGWIIEEAIKMIFDGERDPTTLTAHLDPNSSQLVQRLLRMLNQHESVAPLERTPSLEAPVATAAASADAAAAPAFNSKHFPLDDPIRNDSVPWSKLQTTLLKFDDTRPETDRLNAEERGQLAALITAAQDTATPLSVPKPTWRLIDAKLLTLPVPQRFPAFDLCRGLIARDAAAADLPGLAKALEEALSSLTLPAALTATSLLA
eukprot:CAMPEP_0175839322 /NCGR_PEP_ID=MMETSP0107_2-20121207/18743_1 /TAXON_ID=195067 ORGANISM="Goniomonas pacifica, Strain CCMP1869" /NCGR_SAMPLE_ID=MMETSP0107_2 /ASSEMBLY_ACC=CAM_ASM_000203 /LENGTH=418 /DNA_ID=CAMNT_0017153033 /DNA_START=174 /DNA_END=1427 /DNA_ORIENTATION=-